MSQKDFLFAKIEDAINLSSVSGLTAYLDFCEPSVQNKTEREIARYPESDCAFFGGGEYAERKMMAIFPKGEEPEKHEYPIDIVHIRAKTPLAHRDVLGALTSSGIDRSRIGDINTTDFGAQVFVSKPLGEFIEKHITQIASVMVDAKTVSFDEMIIIEPTFTEVNVIIPSLRIDVLVHAVYKLSRSEASALVKAEKVKVNDNPVLKPGYAVKIGDVVSVRSKGKFIVGDISGMTKKGNTRITLKKYS
ncbi:MAG: hypothetical protein E7218_06600 [Anaerofustis stercorihominis]|nr:hypothetical protein [Anaerofustis stercorihominis]